MLRSILVLCEGNICRSPMAEALLKEALPAHEVYSAGLGALIGMPADPIACRLMNELGLDISEHRARQVNGEIVARSDLILTMESAQRERLGSLYPHVLGRTFLIGQHLKLDVADPYKQGEQSFRSSLQVIRSGVLEWQPRIQKLSSRGSSS